MASNSQSRSGGDGNTHRSWQPRQSRLSEIAASHHRRNDGQSAASVAAPREGDTLIRSESWVELASQPSSSSLSSIGDQIVTTGLRVGNSYPPRRRRLQHTRGQMPSTYIVSHAAAQAGTSSQEEYDETESEEDHILTSSNEQISPSAALPRQQTAIGPTAASDTDDDSNDENSTALGVGRPSTSPTFRPQPNAFSHPPSSLHRHSTSSAVPQQSSSRPSMSQRAHTRPNRGASDIMSPAYQADNDAALRASLTTLLSCARALPKKEPALTHPPAGTSAQPMNLRFAPESELMGEACPGPSTEHPQTMPAHLCQPAGPTASNSSAPSAPSSTSSHSREPASEKTKRERAATPTTRAKSPRAAKKKRTASPAGTVAADAAAAATSISPSVLTWVVSAGVLVLVSVVGFGAGYVIGREVGRQEGAAASLGGGMGFASEAGSNATSCGREVIRSTTPGGTLRRFKWGVGRSVAA